ncbi:unnamed protein product [Penicillium glandicola]
MEGPKAAESKHSIKRDLSGSQDESSTTLQPEDSNVAVSIQASQLAPDFNRLNSFQSKLEQLQHTLDTPMSRWNREADASLDIAHHYAPLGRLDSSVEEAVLEDRSQGKGDFFQGASPINKTNPDEETTFSEGPVGNHAHHEVTTTAAPATSTSRTNISSVVVQCLKVLSRLVSEDLSSFASEVPPALWKDELGRFRVWAANIGAHQTGQSSLDHRLRDASHIREQTLRVLQRLQRITEDINDLLHLSPEDDDFSDLSGGDDDNEHQTEIQSIYHALRDTINNLFQMSMVIRKPAQHDRLLGTKRSDAVFYEQFDRLHVASKYPQAGEDILKRLGLAISERRAVMRYRERHRTKLAQDLDDGKSAKLSDTIATEFVDVSPAAKDVLEFQTATSQTSYAQTILNGAEGAVLPPPPKDSADGAPFECPYCFVIISIPNRRAWARHVFNDLMPYLCIFPSCPTPHRLYESRRGWFSHLQSQHSICKTPGLHVDCPLCLSSVPSGKQLERHVGRHLEELALFALPRSEEEEEEYGDDAAISSDEDYDTSRYPADEGRCPQCHLVFPDLRSHILTHNSTERPEKCPVVTCEYHTKGFIRKGDKNRHALTHYKGVMVCNFCPGSGTPKERSFTRADTFKRHLVAVHGAEQLPPEKLGHRPTSSIKTGINHTSDSTGNCSICNENFRDAQGFFEHIDNCVMLKVMQGNFPRLGYTTNFHEVIDDEEMKETLEHDILDAEDPIDQPDYNNPDSDIGLISELSPDQFIASDQKSHPDTFTALDNSQTYNDEQKTHSPAPRMEGYPSEDPSIMQTGTKLKGLLKRTLGLGSPWGNLNINVHEPPISHTPDYLVDDNEPDMIALRHRETIYPLHFRAYSIYDGVLTVGNLRQEAARVLEAPFPDLVILLYKGNLLKHDNQTCKENGLKQHSEVLCVVSETKANALSDSSNSQRGHASNPPQAQPKKKARRAKKKDKKARDSSPLRDETKTASIPVHPLRHTSPASSSNLHPSLPELKALPTAMEQVAALTRYFEQNLIRLCDEYTAHPPADIKKRDFEHEKLREAILTVMLKSDGIETDGDQTVRNARRALIKQMQDALNRLNAAAAA